MAFTLNAGEFDLGGGFIGRGSLLSGEVYSSGLQGLLGTSGLKGVSGVSTNGWGTGTFILFKPSDDPNQNPVTLNANINAFFVNTFDQAHIDSNVRYGFMINWTAIYNRTYGAINSSDLSKSFVIDNKGTLTDFNGIYTPVTNWRFIARDYATAITHYPSITTGSILVASCVNSSTQWGLWAAGVIGSRSGYFNQRQGDFAIVLLRNGSSWCFSVFSPAAGGSSSRNDSRLRAVNIIPNAGQSGDDRFSELLLFRDQGSGYSERLGTVPGLIYVDMNRAENAALVVGNNLTIEPGVGTTYELTNRGALIVAQWGLDISATISNVGSVFTVDTISSPTSATLAAGNRNRWILENNQRIRFTATPPSGVSAGTDYWILNWDPVAFTFQIASTEGGTAIVPGGDTSSTIVRYAPLIAMPCYKED